MTDGDPSHESADRRGFRRVFLEEVSRPDYMLLGIAGVLAVGLAFSGLFPASQNLVIGASSTLALLLIGDLLFRTPPQASQKTRDGEPVRPDYLTNVQYDSGCVEVWDHLSEVRYGT